MSQHFDLAVIGSGPAGEVAAIRAAQLGLSVVLIEKNQHMGGTCLNVGCIPTKSLIESAKTWDKIQHLSELGFKVQNPEYDWSAILGQKDSVVDQQRKGLVFLMKKNKVAVLNGHARFVDSTHIEVSGTDKVTVTAAHTLICTGSRVKNLPFAKPNGTTIQSSDEILFCKQPPKTLAVIGGGVVGMEFASLFARFGSQVTVIELLEQIIPFEDPESAKELSRCLKKAGVNIETGTRLKGLQDKGKHCVVQVEGAEDRAFDVVLVSIGREPVTNDLGLEKIGIKVDAKGFIPVDAHYKTSLPNVYAVGDVIATPALAHTASAEALHAVEVIKGLHPHVINYAANPSAIYTMPEVASIGMTEPQLQAKGIAYKATKFPFAPLAKAKIENAKDGFIKILSGPKHGELLGVHIVGAKATELIAEFSLGMLLEATVEDIAATIHPHPTISETVMEAAHAAHDQAIHM